jgi:uncharacterized protein DUF5671
MDTVRRLYLYAMSAVSLAVLAFGAQALLTVALHGLGLRVGAPVFGEGSGDRQALSLAIALIGVGLPVWAIHWWLVERSVRRSADAEGERRSDIRALYLSAVLLVFILAGSIAAMSVVRLVTNRLMPVSDDYYNYEDVAATLATLVVVGAGWALHARTRLIDVAGGELRGAAAWLPRLYRYLVAFFGLVYFAQGLGELAKLAIDYVGGTPTADPLSGIGVNYAFQLYQALPAALVGLALWVSHAWASDRVTASDGWHGASERSSRIRLGYWPLIIGVAAIVSITSLGAGLEAIFRQVFGAGGDPNDYLGTNRSLAVEIASAAAAAMPWLAIWWLHRRWGRDAASASGDPGRRTFAARLDRHVSAAVGLAFGAIATGWLVGVLIDVVLGGSRTVGVGWRQELSQFLAWAVLGLALWIWNWSRLLALRQADPAGEASSAVRRAYLLLAIGVAIVSTLGSLAIVLYRLVGYLLGAGLGGNAVSELSTPLGVLIAAAAIVVYHGLQLRSDGELRPVGAAEATAPAAAPLTEAVPTAAMAAEPAEDVATRISLELRGPTGADLEATLAMLRGVLPEGQTLAEG